MDEKVDLVYEFGGFRLHLTQRTLVRNGELVALTPKGIDLLILLVQSRGQLLEKDELMNALWPGTFVEEGNLSQNIFILRRLLGDDRNGNSFIQTVPRKGYRFVASVAEADAAALGNGLSGAAHFALLSDYWSRHSPFRSLQVFEPEDAWLFFGRDTETNDLLARLGRSSVLAMVGNSGSGKSSLVRAGLIPALRAGRFQSEGLLVDQWRIAVFRPSGTPFDYLAEVLPSQLAPELSSKEKAEFSSEWRTKLPAGGDTLRHAINTLASAMPEKAGSARILLVVDQFEEIFTLTTNQQARDRYIDALMAASRPDNPIPVHVVLALRADFYAHCLEHAQLSRCLEANLYNVPRMTHEQLRETIEKRLALAAARAEPGLIDSMLEDVGTEPGNLALLEHALGQLWEKCGRYGCTVTNHAYAEIGRLRGALGRHADEVYAGLGDEKQKRLAQKIFLELVHLGEGAQDTRRRVSKADLLALGAAEEVEALLERLASRRLIAIGREGQETFVEVSHEALIREWPALCEWLAQNREELRLERRLLQAAAEWLGLDHDPGALLQGARLAQAEEWLAKHADAPTLLRQFLQASVEARAEAQERELAHQREAAVLARRSAVRQRWFSCALALMLLVAVGTAWFAHQQQVIAESRALAAQAGELLLQDHGQALDLAIRSWHMAKTQETHLAVAKASVESLGIFKHEGPVNVAMFSPDGQRILSASDDHTARVWNADDGRLLFTLTHDDAVQYAEFSGDGQRVVTASDDHTARVWSGTDGHLLATLQGHTDRIWTAQFSPDGQRIVTASDDRTARVWNSGDGRLLTTLQGHTSSVASARFSPDGQRIVTTSWDHTARVWNTNDGRLLTTFSGHQAEVITADFSPDSQRIVTTSFDKTARVWGSADGRLLFTLQHDGPVVNAMFFPDGQRIVTTSRDHTARVWGNADGRLLFTLQHDGPVVSAAFSPDGRRIVTASHDKTARVWSVDDGRLLAILQGHTNTVYSAAFSPDGQRIVTAGFDNTMRIWNTVCGRMVVSLQGHTGWVLNLAVSKDGQRIVTASYDQTARVWNSANGHLLTTLEGHGGGVIYAAFSPDDQRIVTASADHTARVWNAADGRLLATLQGHSDDIWRAQFSPDGQRIVTASKDHTARVWNSADGRLLAILQGHTDEVWRAQFSSDGQRIVTASKDHTARIWNSSDGRLLFTLQGHTGEVWQATFSRDGERVVTASRDHTARVWNSRDGRLLFTLQGHTGDVWDAEFSPDGQRIVTASLDRTARIWNSSDGHLMATLQGHTDAVWWAMFSPDGQRIVTAGKDRTARVWNSVNSRLLAILQGHAGEITAVAFSPDGQRIVTASLDQTARVWQVLTLDDVNRILAK